ncbi:MAG: hypothetical protein ACLFRG_01075 [Desulfococcaceae bacterium]
MANPKKSLEDMDEDMKGLDHNGMLQRQWKMLKQVLEKNAEAGIDSDESKDENQEDNPSESDDS